jgi:hypothetical protein
MPQRETYLSRDYHGGCETCGLNWRTRNAQALAAQHHDRTGHETFCEIWMNWRYGGKPPNEKKPNAKT